MTDEPIPVSITTITTLQMTMTNMIKFLRRGGAPLPTGGLVRLESVVDDDNIGDQIVTMSWTEFNFERGAANGDDTKTRGA